jgi:hypothetical protein
MGLIMHRPGSFLALPIFEAFGLISSLKNTLRGREGGLQPGRNVRVTLPEEAVVIDALLMEIMLTQGAARLSSEPKKLHVVCLLPVPVLHA